MIGIRDEFYFYFYFILFFLTYSSIVYVLVIHEVFVVKKWVKDARNEVRVEANLHTEANRALGAVEQKNQELNAKLIVEERA